MHWGGAKIASSDERALYDVLEVDRNASQDDIRRAYKRLALIYHPDKQPDDPEKFKDITHAYTVLSDPEKRTYYDETGSHDFADGGGGGGPTHDLHDIFSEIFANMPSFATGHPFMPQGNHGATQSQEATPPCPDKIDIEVSLSDVYHGTLKLVEYEAMDLCGACGGSKGASSSDVISCTTCQGTGRIQHSPMPFIMTFVSCPGCAGAGRTIKNVCPKCEGRGTCYSKRSFELKIPKGILDGHVHVLAGKGGYDSSAKRCKDVHLKFTYDLDEGILVDASSRNVRMSMDIRLEDVLCGFERKLTIYDKTLIIRAPQYIDPSKEFVIPEWGLPDIKGENRANLIIMFRVLYPNEDAIRKYQAILCKIMKRPHPLPEPQLQANDGSVEVSVIT